MQTIYEPKGPALEYSPLALNVYEGCTKGCTYCYVRKMWRQFGKEFETTTLRPGLLEALEKRCAGWKGEKKLVLLCFACDPYPAPADDRPTREVIQILKRHGFPFQVLTKGGMRASRDFDLYGKGDMYAATLTFCRDDDSAQYEPGAARPWSRIRSLWLAHNQGIATWASLEPVIDPEQTVALIEQTHEFVDLFKIGKLNHQKSSIDWRKFARQAIDLCQSLKANYYIKKDLAKYLE